MFRTDFLAGLLMSGVAFCPGFRFDAAPEVKATTNPLERCDRNYVLPYDQPLEFKRRALDAPDLDLQNYRGNVVLLNFFATWCGPCRDEQPNVVEVANTYFDRGLRVIGVNYGEQDDVVRAYRDKYHMRYPIVMDGMGLLARVENNNDVDRVEWPITLFLSEDGMLTCYRTGRMEKDELIYKVERMLAFLHDASQ